MTPPSSSSPGSSARAGGHGGRDALLLGVLLAAMAAGPLFNYSISASSTVVRDRLGITAGQLGSVLTVVFASAAVTAVGLGRAADRLSSRAQLSIIFGGAAASLVIGAFSTTLAALYVAAAVAGVTQAISNPTTNRIIRTAAPPEKRIGWIGIKQSGVQVSQLFGGLFFPAAALGLGWTGASLVAAAVAGVLWVVAVRAAPPLPGVREMRAGAAGAGSPGAAAGDDAGKGAAEAGERDASRLPAAVWYLAAVAFLTGVGMQATNMYLPLFAVEALDLSLVAGGAAAAASGVVGVFSRIWWGRRMTAGHRPTTLLALIALGSLLGAAVFLTADLAHVPALLWVGAAVHGLTVLGANVVINAGLMEGVSEGRLGRATGVNSMGMYAGFACGPLVMGLLRDLTGDFRLGFAAVGAAYALALGVVWLLRRHVDARPEKTESE